MKKQPEGFDDLTKYEGNGLTRQMSKGPSSNFFDRALKGPWKESATRNITIPDVSVTAFQVYAQWLYSGSFYIMGRDNKDIEVAFAEELGIWESCYRLNDFLGSIGLIDALIDKLIDEMNEDFEQTQECARNGFKRGSINLIYKYSTTESPYRILLVDIAKCSSNIDMFQKTSMQKFCEEFRFDLLEAFPDGSDLRCVVFHISDIGNCTYHEHAMKGLPCYAEEMGLDP